jgi:hypothetical protein
MKIRFSIKRYIILILSLLTLNSFQNIAQTEINLETGFYFIIPKNKKNAFVIRPSDTLCVDKEPFLTVKEFEKIELHHSTYNYYNLITLTTNGKKIFSKVASNYLNRDVAAVIDGKLISIIRIKGDPEGKIALHSQNYTSKSKEIENYKKISKEMNLDTSYFNIKQYILSDIDFDKISTYESDKRGTRWREAYNDKAFICTDKEVISEIKKQIYYIDNGICNDNNTSKVFYLFKNKKIIESYFYCDSNQSNLLNFKDKFHLTKLYDETFSSKKELLNKYTQLKNEDSCLGIETIPPSQYLIGDGCLTIDLFYKDTPNDTSNYINFFSEKLKILLKLNESDFTVSEVVYTNDQKKTKIIANIRCTNEYGRNFNKDIFRNDKAFGSVGKIEYIEDLIKSDDFNNTQKTYKIFYRK